MRRAVIETGPLGPGGAAGRADDALTEDEFYGGPLRGIFAALDRRRWLRAVSTLVLDGLTVTADVVREIIHEDRFAVRVLSLRGCRQLNQRRLCQVLMYAVRASRPAGTPRLRALYVFGPPDAAEEDGPPAAGRGRPPARHPGVPQAVREGRRAPRRGVEPPLAGGARRRRRGHPRRRRRRVVPAARAGSSATRRCRVGRRARRVRGHRPVRRRAVQGPAARPPRRRRHAPATRRAAGTSRRRWRRWRSATGGARRAARALRARRCGDARRRRTFR